MPITLVAGRQDILVAEVSFAYTDLVSAAAEPAVQLPPNAVVVGGGIVVDTVWNSATSDLADVGDANDPNRYSASQVNLAAAGFTALDVTGYKDVDGLKIDITWTGVGAAPSQGAARMFVHYAIADRSVEVQPAR
ncbi:MAG: hypothetical protein GTN99_08055 [Candidatus Dadabacteria bacterium]|nr:hypothetical protein [Candidatus Dadabacteria bacterium]